MSFLIANRKIIGEIIGLALICLVVYWFFIHNPKVIDGLEKDKAELSRQVAEGVKAQTLLNDISKGKVEIDNATFKQISSIRAASIPRRAVLIRGGMPLQTMH